MVRTLWSIFPHGYHAEPHEHTWHQLIYASSGVLHVRADVANWVIPSHRAVWIPAGTRHEFLTHGETAARALYFPSHRKRLWAGCQVLQVTPLLRELIIHATELGVLYEQRAAHARLIAVVLDQMRAAQVLPLALPMPKDPRALRLAEEIRRHPEVPLDRLAQRVGAAKRTLERLFAGETGMTVGRWRQQLRLLESLKHLAAGEGVSVAAVRVGYESASAFISAFRETFGTTPGCYYAE